MGAVEVIAYLRANTSEFTAKIGEAKLEMDKLEKSGSGGMEKMQKVGGAALLGVGAVAVGVGLAAVDMADKYDTAHVSLEASAKAAGTSFEALKPQIDSTSKAMEGFGYTNAQTEAAVGSLITSQGKNAPVMKDMQLAANIAAAKHIDLQTAIGLVEKASNGMTKPLKAMGIDLNIAAGGAKATAKAQDGLAKAQDAMGAILAKSPDALNASSKAHAAYEVAVGKVESAQKKLSDTQSAGGQIIGALSERFSGQASAAAGTMSGKLAEMKANGENLLQTLGQKLIPVLDKVVTAIQHVVTWLEKHKGVAEAIAIVIGTVLVGAIAVYVASMASAAVATIAATWPLLLIVAAVALVGVAIYELHAHWKQVWALIGPYVDAAWAIIKPIFDVLKTVLMVEIKAAVTIVRTEFEIAWTLISTAINVAWAIIKPIFDILKTVLTIDIKLGIEILRTAFDVAWGAISAVIKVAWDIIKPVWGFIKDGITDVQTVVGALSDAWSSIWQGLGAAVTSAYNTYIKPAVDVVMGAVNTVKNAWDAVFGGGGSSKPATPAPPTGATINHAGRASGGPVSSLSTYLVGEQGPELFTPSSSGTIIPNGALGGGSDTPVHITVQIAGTDVGSVLLPSLLRLKRTGGYGTLGLT